MKLKKLTIYCLALFCSSSSVYAQSGEEVQKKRSGNPIFPGWYADPEGVVLDGKFWIYPTYSAPYDEQTFMDAYSSPDLVHWTKHPRVLSKEISHGCAVLCGRRLLSRPMTAIIFLRRERYTEQL